MYIPRQRLPIFRIHLTSLLQFRLDLVDIFLAFFGIQMYDESVRLIIRDTHDLRRSSSSSGGSRSRRYAQSSEEEESSSNSLHDDRGGGGGKDLGRKEFDGSLAR